MPRRRAKRKTTRRRKNGGAIRFMPILWAYAQIHLLSMNVMGTTPYNVLTAGTAFNPNVGAWGTGTGVGGHKEIITLKELLAGVQTTTSGAPSPITQMGSNLRANLLPLFFGMISLGVAQKMVTKFGFNRSVNRLSDNLGTGSIIRAS